MSDNQKRKCSSLITNFFPKVLRGSTVPPPPDEPELPASTSSLDTTNPAQHSICSPQSTALDVGRYVSEPPDDSDLILSLINTPWTPDESCVFPKNNKNRSFQLKWTSDFNWLVYSDVLQGALCKFCVLFAKTSSIQGKKEQQYFGSLVRTAYKNWKNAKENFKYHQERKYHKDSVNCFQDLLRTKAKPALAVSNQLNTSTLREIEKNRKRLAPIFECILFCGRQEISLRGHNDSGPLSLSEPTERDGNFRAILRMRASCGDESLKSHLLAMGDNTRYFSPTIQNDIIECFGFFIQNKLVHQINQAKCFSIMADETTDISGIEQLSICVRYVKDEAMREDFLTFVPMVRTTGEELAIGIVSALRNLNVELQYLRGQGYDGCGLMSGRVHGVQTRIRNSVTKKALYVHCSSHSLNLALGDSCGIPEIRNTLGTISKVVTFLTRSAIRLNCLKSTIQSNYSEKIQTSYKLISYCETRFVERHDSILRFAELFNCVVDTLGIIECDGDKEASSTAHSYLAAILTPTFIVSMCICEEILACTLYLSQSLQDTQYDLVRALTQVDDTLATLSSWRSGATSKFQCLFQKAQQIAESQFVTMSVPRTVSRQTKRSNTPSSTPEEYYKRNVYIVFIDHMITSLKDRFQEHRSIIRGLQHLVPSLIDKEYSLNETLNFYNDDLIGTISTVLVEANIWCHKWKNVPKNNRPKNALSAYAECDEICFPNIKKLLKILVTLPVSSNTPERTFSTVRRLKTYLRNTTSENRLNGLALMSIYRETPIEISRVMDIFGAKKARRLKITL